MMKLIPIDLLEFEAVEAGAWGVSSNIDELHCPENQVEILC